jgi:hypothetical protein
VGIVSGKGRSRQPNWPPSKDSNWLGRTAALISPFVRLYLTFAEKGVRVKAGKGQAAVENSARCSGPRLLAFGCASRLPKPAILSL